MRRFRMNGILWRIVFVDPESSMLIDRTGRKTVATTDPITNCVYLADNLHGNFLKKVIIHELGHCAMISYDLIDDIHSMVDEDHWIDVEEWICNFISDYGEMIFSSMRSILGKDALSFIPYVLENIV